MSADTKIVIVAGQEFSVPASTDNEAIRQQLAGMGFADVAGASIQQGTRTLDGVLYPTVEFVKKAGVKGMDATGVAILLGGVPPAKAQKRLRWGPNPRQARLLADLHAGRFTIAQALAQQDDLTATFRSLERPANTRKPEGVTLCTQLDTLAPDAASDVSGW